MNAPNTTTAATGNTAGVALFSPVSPDDMVFPPIDVWDNKNQQRDFVISTSVPEFTSVCPMTGLPDYGTITVDYIPDKGCIELKAFKYYMMAYRNVGIFYENVVNRILTDLVNACQPKYMRVRGQFTPRGGISTQVVVDYIMLGQDRQTVAWLMRLSEPSSIV
jgi:7-cyano-7-deazaguanine reductase